MGKSNQQRRAAKKRRRQQREGARHRPHGRAHGAAASGQGPTPPPSVEELLHAARYFWQAEPSSYARAVAALAERPRAALDAASRQLDGALDDLWRSGWTPRDVTHVATRRLSPAHGSLAAWLAVADGERRRHRRQPLHPRWEAQLETLASAEGAARPGVADLEVAVALLCLLARLAGIPQTMPPPGDGVSAAVGQGTLDERVLGRVRGLLAKAEATTFDAEAEALTAKAQELIARHAIDQALLHKPTDVGNPSVRRLLIDDPYADAKASLLAEVAEANLCRTVYSPDLGWVTAFGYEHDLDAVELLSASLLAQATSAMARHGSLRDASGRSRTRSFRRSFLFGFAHRIGQRLRETTDEAVTAAASSSDRLLPVLAAREDRLRDAVAAAFPEMVRKVSAVTNTRGFVAGQVAADLASLDVSAGALRDTPAS